MSEIWRRAEPKSPCVKLCVLHPVTGLCLGCARSRDEIAGWAAMSAEQRQRILDALPQRRVAPGRRGGRAGRLSGDG